MSQETMKREVGRCAESALINDDGLLVLIFIIIFHSLPPPCQLCRERRRSNARAPKPVYVFSIIMVADEAEGGRKSKHILN
jgi:hypothetical protein